MKKTKLPVLVMCLVVLSINVIYAKASEKNSSEHKNIALPIDIPNSPPNTFQIMLQTIRQFFDPPRDSITTTPKPNKSVTSNSRNNIEFSGKLEKPIKLNATLSKSKTVAKMQDHIGCPSERNTRFQLFPLACKRHEDCLKFGNEQRCCDLFGSKRCVEGQSKPLIDDLNHEPLFGVVKQKCPSDPLTETFWTVQKCKDDRECGFPRICCPSGRERFCFAGQIESESLPVARQLAYPVESLSQYFQCTPPPSLIFDKSPKACNNTLDCFPNMCCQENGKRFCRPPRRSLLSALTTNLQRFNVGLIKDFTDNLVIRR